MRKDWEALLGFRTRAEQLQAILSPLIEKVERLEKILLGLTTSSPDPNLPSASVILFEKNATLFQFDMTKLIWDTQIQGKAKIVRDDADVQLIFADTNSQIYAKYSITSDMKLQNLSGGQHGWVWKVSSQDNATNLFSIIFSNAEDAKEFKVQFQPHYTFKLFVKFHQKQTCLEKLSSLSSLRDLKQEIHKAFHFPPLFQKLFLGKTILSGDQKNLQELGITNNSTIVLIGATPGKKFQKNNSSQSVDFLSADASLLETFLHGRDLPEEKVELASHLAYQYFIRSIPSEKWHPDRVLACKAEIYVACMSILSGKKNSKTSLFTKEHLFDKLRKDWPLLHSIDRDEFDICLKELEREELIQVLDEKEGLLKVVFEASYFDFAKSYIQPVSEKGENLVPSDETLWNCFLAKQLDLLEFLVSEKGVNCQTSLGATPLLIASQIGWIEGVKLCLEHGADVSLTDQSGMTPLHCAAQENHLSVVKLLVEAGSPINHQNVQGYTPLHAAAELGHLSIVQFLIEKGASPVLSNKSGWSPLHSSIRGCFRDLTFLLLRHTPGVAHLVTDQRYTALHVAVEFDQPEVAFLLLQAGAHVNAASIHGGTPLMIAAQVRSASCAKLLIDREAKLDLTDMVGNTALHMAALRGYEDIVRLLLQAGASKTIPNKFGMTPGVLAAAQNRIACAKLLS